MRAKEGNVWDVLPDQSDTGSELFPVKSLSLGPPVLTPENEQYLIGGGVYRLGSWPYSKFAAIPTPIVWALLRAGNTVNLAFRQHTKDALMIDFQKILESMCKSTLEMFTASNADTMARSQKDQQDRRGNWTISLNTLAPCEWEDIWANREEETGYLL